MPCSWRTVGPPGFGLAEHASVSLLPSPTRKLELFARIEMFYKDALRHTALGFAGLDRGALRGP